MGLVYLGLVGFSCLLVSITAQPVFRYSYCFNYNNYTTNSVYKTNLNTLLSNLTSNAEIDYGFYNLSYGVNLDRVNAIGLCRGDVKPYDCRSCLDNSRVRLPHECPVQKKAIGGYDECMLYYSNHLMSGLVESNFSIHMWNIEYALDWNQYNQVVRDLLNRIRSTAASGDSHRKFAVANTTGGRVIKIGCNFRFENYLFYEFSTDALIPTSPSQNLVPTSTTSSQVIIIAIVVPIIAIVVLLIFFSISRARKPKKDSEGEAETENDTTDSIQFKFRIIQHATNNFSHENKLGEGGFGPVYKGRLSNGQEVAIKSRYMATEYAVHGKFSTKSNAFSLGVLVLEIISGKKNSGSCNENVEHLPSIAWKNWRRGTNQKL
ncbi:hypothetical protein L6164_032156 [Bauhinia variegata]|uniref:Uncharacterized protein n=1 Tax=Bauhinia variegata TaxID=167791 RepID=A0ACB9KN97_BAUVA|nr:hypothetical protein L6164_032156 [Bauhinia variegata]